MFYSACLRRARSVAQHRIRARDGTGRDGGVESVERVRIDAGRAVALDTGDPHPLVPHLDRLRGSRRSYRIVSCRVVSYRSYRNVQYCTVPYRISYRIVSYRNVSFCIVSYRFVSYRFVCRIILISSRLVSYLIVEVSFRIIEVSYRFVS